MGTNRTRRLAARKPGGIFVRGLRDSSPVLPAAGGERFEIKFPVYVAFVWDSTAAQRESSMPRREREDNHKPGAYYDRPPVYNNEMVSLETFGKTLWHTNTQHSSGRGKHRPCIDHQPSLSTPEESALRESHPFRLRTYPSHHRSRVCTVLARSPCSCRYTPEHRSKFYHTPHRRGLF